MKKREEEEDEAGECRSSPSNLSGRMKNVDSMKRSTCLSSVYCSGSAVNCSRESSTVESAGGGCGNGGCISGVCEIDYRRLSEGCIQSTRVANELEDSETRERVRERRKKKKQQTQRAQQMDTNETKSASGNEQVISKGKEDATSSAPSGRAVFQSESSESSSQWYESSVSCSQSCGNNSLHSIHSDCIHSEILSQGDSAAAAVTEAVTSETTSEIIHPPSDVQGARVSDKSNNNSSGSSGSGNSNGSRHKESATASGVACNVWVTVPDPQIREAKEEEEDAAAEEEEEEEALDEEAVDEEARSGMKNGQVTRGRRSSSGNGSRKLSQLQKIARKIRASASVLYIYDIFLYFTGKREVHDTGKEREKERKKVI